MSDAQVPEKVYTKQWWTEEELRATYYAAADRFAPPTHAEILAALTPAIERIQREAKVEALKDEAEWLKTAHANSIDKGYSREYRSGFEAAQGWVRLHAQIQEESTR